MGFRFILEIFLIGIILLLLLVRYIKSASAAKIRAELERGYQEKHKRLESEFAEKEAALEERELKVAKREYELESVSARVQYASACLQKAKEIEMDVAQREYEFEQREQELHKSNEEMIARRVDEGIKGRQKGVDENWVHIMRKARVLEEDEQKMYERAVLIANHLGVPLKCILSRREKKLVDKIANELVDERQALIDLVMSCPDDQVKELLASMQRFPRNWQQ